MGQYRVVYLCADLRRVGPTNQTLNIICNANDTLSDVLVLTLFDEPENSIKGLYLQKGIKCESLSLKRNNILVAILKLMSFFKRNQVGFVHSYGVKPDILLYIVSRLTSVPYVLTQRCIPIEDYPVRMQRIAGVLIAKLHTFVLKHSQHVVTCSEYLCDVMRTKYGFKNVMPIQNGIDVDRFKKLDKQTLRSLLNIDSKAVVFISSGLFLERKHNDEIIEAFINVKPVNGLLIMLGDGPLFDDMKKKYSNQKNILFTGLVSNITEYLSASDYFVSASDSEGLPNAVLEALACGAPVILSDIPQHREILNTLPDCGESFSLHNVKQLSILMEKCSTKQILFGNTVDRLKNSPFTMKFMGASYKAYYEKNLNGY